MLDITDAPLQIEPSLSRLEASPLSVDFADQASPNGQQSRPALIAPGANSITTWHVARVSTVASEMPRIRQALRQLGYQSYHPRFIEHSRKGEELRPYFVGYLLFGVQPGDTWGEASRVPGVYAILGNKMTGNAAVVPTTTVDNWIEKCGPMGIHDPKPVGQPLRKLEAGTSVVVTQDGGAFAGLHALVRLDDGDRVKVLMDILGGERVVTLPKERIVQINEALS